MRLSIVLEYRFCQLPDGSAWTSANYSRDFWERYLSVFDGIEIVARAEQLENVPEQWRRVDGDGVQLTPLPHYVGPSQYLRTRGTVKKAVRAMLNNAEALIIRVPSIIGGLAIRELSREKMPYGLEIVGDPWDTFSRGAIRHPLRVFFRKYFARALRRQCASALISLYVTEHALQRRYPSRAAIFTTNASNVEMKNDAFINRPKQLKEFQGQTRRIVFVGSLAQIYKGPDVLIKAMTKVLIEGIQSQLTIVGGGKYLPEMIKLAGRCGIGEKVEFKGQLPPGNAVRAQLDQSDIFVLPSRNEGLPRSLIEAMGRGLPCIGSRIGGIPELLNEDCLVTPDSVNDLAKKIKELSNDPIRMARESARNLNKSKEFAEQVLSRRRKRYYLKIIECTNEWRRKRVPL